jgi:serine-type D-Ala-D-Ala carboxypeptidase/endopeptidase
MRLVTGIAVLVLCTAAESAWSQSALDGFWLGTLKAGEATLRIQVTVKSGEDGKWQCVLDSLDQGAYGIPCSNIAYADPDLSFDVPQVKGRWVGKVSADHNQLAGTWTQIAPLPLTLDRQAAPIRPAVAGMTPALPPVSVADMKAVLTRDLEQQLTSGKLAPGAPFGLAIGVVRKGERSVFTFGTAKTDSLFEIGSITKTFTGLALAQMIEQGKVKPETTVRELLPAGIVKKPEGAEITLIDLTAQDSGLPRLPDNMTPADVNNPYVDYDAAKLYAFMGKHGVARPADAKFLYSNLGVGLLGHALSLRAGKPYAQLIKEEITDPLGMKDTVITLPPSQQSRFIQGYSADRRAVHSWELDALAGAGAIRSTAGDMVTYLEAQLHPEKAPARLRAAIVRSQTIQGDTPMGKIAFNWLQNARNGDFLHDGGTAGFSSFAFFNPKEDFGAIVLVNTGPAPPQPFATLVGMHIRQRFGGVEAVSLDDPPALRR